MQNVNSVMTTAFDGYVLEVSDELGITDKRIYHILGKENPYLKTWRLLNPLGRIAPERLRLVQADFNARCARILDKNSTPSTASSVHKEFTEAMQTILDKAPRYERKKEILEAIAELNKELEKCEVNGDCE